MARRGHGGCIAVSPKSTKVIAGAGVGAPLILWPALDGVDFTFAFPIVVGLTCEVQFQDSLADPGWQTLQTMPGDGSQKIITNSIAAPRQCFYPCALNKTTGARKFTGR